jgi:16S rRNA (guanine527-N7)-methyltransferase
MESIRKYFPALSELQYQRLERLGELYEHWNAQINVISRKDMDQFYERHVLHSLAIAKVVHWLPRAKVLDVGTGGGFPGLPLAIIFPEVQFTLVDSIQKKIKVVEAVANTLDLSNLSAQAARVEKITGKFDFVVSRAVTQMPKFLALTRGKLRRGEDKANLPNGLLYLKGGDLMQELAGIKPIQIFELSNYFEEEFFETKKIVFKPA